MITNEIMVGKHFKMKVNFNLVKKHGSEKRQIWLTATIKGDRCRVFTGERIEEQYWQKSNRTELGERAIENIQKVFKKPVLEFYSIYRLYLQQTFIWSIIVTILNSYFHL